MKQDRILYNFKINKKTSLQKSVFTRFSQKTEVQRQVNQHLISDNLNRDFLVFIDFNFESTKNDLFKRRRCFALLEIRTKK